MIAKVSVHGHLALSLLSWVKSRVAGPAHFMASRKGEGREGGRAEGAGGQREPEGRKGKGERACDRDKTPLEGHFPK